MAVDAFNNFKLNPHKREVRASDRIRQRRFDDAKRNRRTDSIRQVRIRMKAMRAGQKLKLNKRIRQLVKLRTDHQTGRKVARALSASARQVATKQGSATKFYQQASDSKEALRKFQKLAKSKNGDAQTATKTAVASKGHAPEAQRQDQQRSFSLSEAMHGVPKRGDKAPQKSKGRTHNSDGKKAANRVKDKPDGLRQGEARLAKDPKRAPKFGGADAARRASAAATAGAPKTGAAVKDGKKADKKDDNKKSSLGRNVGKEKSKGLDQLVQGGGSEMHNATAGSSGDDVQYDGVGEVGARPAHQVGSDIDAKIGVNVVNGSESFTEVYENYARYRKNLIRERLSKLVERRDNIDKQMRDWALSDRIDSKDKQMVLDVVRGSTLARGPYGGHRA